ncbi:MAG: hypothetical protein QM723_22790 [Myxococcaceae bacterium]
MGYRVVYDIATAGYGDAELLPGVIAMVLAPFVVAASVAVKRVRVGASGILRPDRWAPKVVSVIWRVSASLMFVWGVAWVGFSYSRHEEAVQRLEGGDVSLVEGRVTDFKPQGARTSEQFIVAGVPFHYSGSTFGPGFRTPHARGGPIAEGVLVRIHCSGNDILRLELAEPPAQ